MQQVVGDDRVVHPHAAFVEHAEDGLVADAARRRARCRDRDRRRGRRRTASSVSGRACERSCAIVPVAQPLGDRVACESVGEVLAPDRAVADPGLGERAIQVEQAHQARPLAAPVGEREDRAAMSSQSGQHVAGVLPARLGDDQRRVGIDARERLRIPCAWLVDEAVPLHRIDRRGRGRPVGPVRAKVRSTIRFERRVAPASTPDWRGAASRRWPRGRCRAR